MAIRKDMVTVVVPTFNEEEAIGMVLDEVRAAGYENILVVDMVILRMVRLRWPRVGAY